MNLVKICSELQPNKVIFLQPSGGISRGDERLSYVNLDRIEESLDLDELTIGQLRFIALVKELVGAKKTQAVYIIASPLNLLAELFTTKGSGTMLRRGAKIKTMESLAKQNKTKLKRSIEDSFGCLLYTSDAADE